MSGNDSLNLETAEVIVHNPKYKAKPAGNNNAVDAIKAAAPINNIPEATANNIAPLNNPIDAVINNMLDTNIIDDAIARLTAPKIIILAEARSNDAAIDSVIDPTKNNEDAIGCLRQMNFQ